MHVMARIGGRGGFPRRSPPPTYSVGQIVGRLTLLAPVAGRAAWSCACSCGKTCERSDEQLRAKPVPTCGHGHITEQHPKRTHPTEYSVWTSMRSRCIPQGSGDTWENYGGRGIRVCPAWQESFEVFLRDMGPRPSLAHSVERKDGNGNYEPGNCVWATRTVQNRNRRNVPLLTFQGRTMCRSAWAAELGWALPVLVARLRTMSVEEALMGPPRRGGRKAA